MSNKALDIARQLIAQVCVCGHVTGDHSFKHPHAAPGLKGLGLGPCVADSDTRCRCVDFRPAPLDVIVRK